MSYFSFFAIPFNLYGANVNVNVNVRLYHTEGKWLKRLKIKCVNLMELISNIYYRDSFTTFMSHIDMNC